MAVWLLVSGSILSLLKGVHYEGAALLGGLLAALLACRRRFDRQGSLLHEPWRPAWIAGVVLAVAGAGWFGVFLHRHVEYRAELWWTFHPDGDVPRVLRAGAGVVAALLLFAIRRLLEPHRPEPHPAQVDELERAAGIIARSPRTTANLALLGDKSFLFNGSGTAFVMYAVQGRSWIALGAPVGPVEERAELVWDFREECDEYDGWPVTYQLGPEDLPLYADQGLTVLKLGEEARVRLTDFTLEGGNFESFRSTCQRMEREGCEFSVVPREAVAPLLPELRGISDRWLAEKPAGEKGFAVGFFSADYLRRFPCAVVRREGEIQGFANLWQGAERAELSVDLMRYRPDAPDGLRDFLLVELMRWGRQEGYGWFNLGLTPLAGAEDRALEPLWSRAAGVVFRHIHHYPSPQGLRE